MASSPTPSIDSMRGTNSVESCSENNEYLSDSPLTLSESSPPVSVSAVCENFSSTGLGTIPNENDHQNSISVSVSSSSSSSSGLSGCGSSESSNNETDVLRIAGKGNTCNGMLSNNLISIITDKIISIPHCTACKSKQSNAVAKCFECVNFLCSNCVTAHEFMNCFDGHTVCLINSFDNSPINNSSLSSSTLTLPDYKCSSLSMMLLQQQYPRKDHIQQSTIDNGQNKLYVSKKSASNVVDDDLHSFTSLVNTNINTKTKTAVTQHFCGKHNNETLKFFCRPCGALVCKDCILVDHSAVTHEVFPFDLSKYHAQEMAPFQVSENIIQSIVTDLRGRIGETVTLISNSDSNINKLKEQYQKAYNELNETYQFFRSILDERKQELAKELETFYDAKTNSSKLGITRSKEFIEKIILSCDTIEANPKLHSISDVLMLRKTFELQNQANLQQLLLPLELEFISSYQSIQSCVRNTFGFIRSSSQISNSYRKQPPIARPIQGVSMNTSPVNTTIENGNMQVSTPLLDNSHSSFALNTAPACQNEHVGFDNSSSNHYRNIILNKVQSSNSSPYARTLLNDVGLQLNPYEKWSNGGSDNYIATSEQFSLPFGSGMPSSNNFVLAAKSTSGSSSVANKIDISALCSNLTVESDNFTTKLFSSAIYPPKSQIKRQKMIYHCKFGEFGVMEGQFTEPSGVAINAQNDIIVADTNNHRIQIFDKDGRFKFQFGECGKRDSQLLYPNRVAVIKTSGDIIVTERSPTHQIQIYNQYGQFVRKFGANILQHPRGVTVDNKGRIIVVECKVMRVIIFDQNGNVIQKFGCSKHLEFPNGVVVNEKQEIFISDNRAHCVKVFNYEGHFLRQIGGEGITNYPIGVGINMNGEILIADNHNNFNLTIFTQDGGIVSALESKVKHAQCFDVALMEDGSVVLASKDYRLYIYRYIQIPPISL